MEDAARCRVAISRPSCRSARRSVVSRPARTCASRLDAMSRFWFQNSAPHVSRAARHCDPRTPTRRTPAPETVRDGKNFSIASPLVGHRSRSTPEKRQRWVDRSEKWRSSHDKCVQVARLHHDARSMPNGWGATTNARSMQKPAEHRAWASSAGSAFSGVDGTASVHKRCKLHVTNAPHRRGRRAPSCRQSRARARCWPDGSRRTARHDTAVRARSS